MLGGNLGSLLYGDVSVMQDFSHVNSSIYVMTETEDEMADKQLALQEIWLCINILIKGSNVVKDQLYCDLGWGTMQSKS